MARLQFGRLSEAWRGEAADFTPLLAQQLDVIGDAIGVDLASVGESEVVTAGGRRIDIVAEGDDGSEFVVENQYGRADHDHLTRGLAYAIAREAKGIVVVAEEHRDEFRAVAQYLNALAEHDPARGIAVWLVEAKAVRIGDSSWAPLFTTVAGPNSFTTRVEQAKQSTDRLGSLDDFAAASTNAEVADAARNVVAAWLEAGHRHRLGANHIVLEAVGPSVGGWRTVVALYTDGRVLVPFNAYEGQQSGIPIPDLTTREFRSAADRLFGFDGSERQARTSPGWLGEATTQPLVEFCLEVAEAFAATVDAREL